MIYLYVTPSGSVNLQDADKMPDSADYAENFQDGSGTGRYDAKGYEDALKAAKASSVPVDDSLGAIRIIQDKLRKDNPNLPAVTFEDTFYGPFDIGYRIHTSGLRHAPDVDEVAILLPEKEPDHEDYTKRLKPCPMCGGKPGESVFFIGYLRPGDYGVKCIACSMSLHQDRVDKVIGVWNTRDAKTGLLDPIAALKESEPVGKLEEKEEQAAAMYLGKQFVDCGDLNEKAEQQIINAFKAGVKWAQGRGSL